VVDFISERIKPDQNGKARPLSSIVEEVSAIFNPLSLPPSRNLTVFVVSIFSFKRRVSSKQLLDHCLAPDTSGDGTGCDNMTCIIVTLRPHPVQSDDKKKRKLQEVAEGTEPEENGNDSKKAKSD